MTGPWPLNRMNVEPPELIDRDLDDLIEQTKAVFRTRGVDPKVISLEFLEYWLTRGKSPLDVVNIALGYRRPDAHLGGIDE